MKLIAKPIDMVTFFTEDGQIKPIRFHILNEKDTLQVIKINHILSVQHEKKAGNPVMIFKCQSTIGDICKVYELKYELLTSMWILYKI